MPLTAVALFTTSCADTEVVDVGGLPGDANASLTTDPGGPGIAAALFLVDAEVTDVGSATATRLLTYVEQGQTYVAIVEPEAVSSVAFDFTYRGDLPEVTAVEVADPSNDLYASLAAFQFEVTTDE